MTAHQGTNLTPFQERLIEKIQAIVRGHSASLESIVEHEDILDAFRTHVNVNIVTPSGRCEVWLHPEEAEVFWGERVARFEKDDYPGGGLDEAVLNCLALLVSGEALRRPESFPVAGGCMLVPTFPFIWPLGKAYHGLREKKEKKRKE